MIEPFKTRHNILHYYYLKNKLKYDEAQNLFDEYLKDNESLDNNLLVLAAEGEIQFPKFIGVLTATRENRKQNPQKVHEYEKYELKKPEGEKAFLTEKYVKLSDEAEAKKAWNEKHPILYGIFVAVFSAALSLTTGYILQQSDNQSKNQEKQELQKQVQDVNKRVDSLANSQKHITDSAK